VPVRKEDLAKAALAKRGERLRIGGNEGSALAVQND